MSFEFISNLAESRLVPAQSMMNRWRADELADLVVLYFCSLYILYSYKETHDFASSYARRTIQYGTNFEQWKSSGTDLYVMLYGLKSDVKLRDSNESDHFKNQMPFGEPLLVRWLKELMSGTIHTPTHRAVFARLDFNFKVDTSSIRAIRRLTMDWNDLSEHERRLTMTRLLQLLRSRAPKSELLGELKHLASRRELELDDVCDKETGEGCGAKIAVDAGPTKTGTFLSALAGVAAGIAVSKALDRKK